MKSSNAIKAQNRGAMASRRVRMRAPVALLAMISAAASAQEAPVSPGELLARSHAAAAQLTPDERTFYLAFLLQTAAAMHHPLTRTWTEELLALASKLPQDWNTMAIQKNGIRALSEIDPEGAMSLMRQLGNPVPGTDGKLREDVRADAAIVVFSRYWKKVGIRGLSEIRSVATYFGDTGEYPYIAILPILRDLATQDASAAEPLFAEALYYFGRSSDVESTNANFVQFLLQGRPFMPRALLAQGTYLAAGRLSDKKSSQTTLLYLGRTTTSTGSVEFKSESEHLLYQLMPLIREIDPKFADRLIDDNKKLNSAANDDGQEHFEGGVITGHPSTQVIAAAQHSNMERSRLHNVREIASKDPNGALQLARTITDQEMQAEALAVVAGAYASVDPAKAQQLYNESEELLKKVGNPEGTLTALVELARAAQSSGDDQKLGRIVANGVSVGEKLFERELETFPGQAAPLVRAFDPLTKLVAIGAKSLPDATLAYVNNVADNVLQTYLLVSAAEGVFEGQRSANSRKASTHPSY